MVLKDIGWHLEVIDRARLSLADLFFVVRIEAGSLEQTETFVLSFFFFDDFVFGDISYSNIEGLFQDRSVFDKDLIINDLIR